MTTSHPPPPATPTPAPSTPMTLFQRLGGENAVMAAVHLFYQRVTADPLLAPFFSKLDLPRQVQKQIGFMTHAFGGAERYHGKNMRDAHRHLVRDSGLTDVHFDAI